MIIGTIEISDGVLHTSNDSFALIYGTNFTVPRPFREIGIGIAVLLSTFGFAFHDLLYFGELLTIAGFATVLAIAGNTIGNLVLINWHLPSSSQTVALWGTFGHLNRIRRQVAESANSANRHHKHKEDKS